MMFCSNCGAENDEGENFCGSCGTRISKSGLEKVAKKKYPHELATLFGYIFAILGGWFGLVFGIYLLSKEHPKAKVHGLRILVLTIIMIVFWLLILGI